MGQSNSDILECVTKGLEDGCVISVFDVAETFELNLLDAKNILNDIKSRNPECAVLYSAMHEIDGTIVFRLNKDGGEFFGIAKNSIDIRSTSNYRKLVKPTVAKSVNLTETCSAAEKEATKKTGSQKSILSFFGKK